MSTITVPSSIYRPKRVPRLLRKQATLIRMLSFLGIVAIFALLVAWRNFTIQQLTIDVARQRTEMMRLDQEIQHVTASIETAAPYNEVADWALTNHGWKSRATRVDTIHVTSNAKSFTQKTVHVTSATTK